jgi:DNA-binding response OmpR family regulator
MSGRGIARVLVVDDEPELRQLLVEALSGGDLEISAVASGREAIEFASRTKVDFIVADIYLGDCSGLDVLDKVRCCSGKDIPAVVITGHDDVASFLEASRRHPVELMIKPLDVDRLRSAIRRELARREASAKWQRRNLRLRRVAHRINRQRKTALKQLQGACADLNDAYRALNGQLSLHKSLLDYQRELIATKNDDDVFRSFFRLFVQHSGPVYGVSLVCNADAELQIIGRFGVPQPDSLQFCKAISRPIVDAVLTNPRFMLMDLSEEQELFDESIRKYLAGVTVLAVPLIPSAGEMIGLAILYRKGEQPFSRDDAELARTIGSPTAVAIRRND